MAADGLIFLAWLDFGDGQWQNAVQGNIGSNLGGFRLGAWVRGDMTLGDWGVSTADHTVWAVLDHNSQFAVVPEPSTLALLAAAAMAVVGCRLSVVSCRFSARGGTVKNANCKV